MKVAIFKPGTHTSAQGKVRTWTEQDCERIVELYNEQPDDERHEAPAVIGHPKHNDPAYGWIEKLEFSSGKVYAHIKECAAEFTEWLEAGFYKKVSPSFYSDGKLRHVGFLGGNPPAIKGLPQFEYSDADGEETYEYSDYRVTKMAGLFRRVREWILEKDGADVADKVMPNDDLDYLSEPPYDETQWLRQEIAELRGIVNTLTDNSPRTSYSENAPMDGKTPAVNAAAPDKEQPATVPDDYAELKTKVDEQGKLVADQRKLIDDQSKVIAALEARNREADFREYLGSEELKGRITPGNRAIAMSMLKRAADLEGEFDYAEGDETKKGTALDVCKAELRTWPKVLDFSEIAGPGRAAGAQQIEKTGFEFNDRDGYDEDRRELTIKAKKVAAEKNIDFNEAVNLVLSGGN